MSTILITVNPMMTQGTGAPRAVHVRFPMGNPVGEPNKPNQQKRIVRSALEVLGQIGEPGAIVHLPYRWRRMRVREDDRTT